MDAVNMLAIAVAMRDSVIDELMEDFNCFILNDNPLSHLIITRC